MASVRLRVERLQPQFADKVLELMGSGKAAIVKVNGYHRSGDKDYAYCMSVSDDTADSSCAVASAIRRGMVEFLAERGVPVWPGIITREASDAAQPREYRVFVDGVEVSRFALLG